MFVPYQHPNTPATHAARPPRACGLARASHSDAETRKSFEIRVSQFPYDFSQKSIFLRFRPRLPRTFRPPGGVMLVPYQHPNTPATHAARPPRACGLARASHSHAETRKSFKVKMSYFTSSKCLQHRVATFKGSDIVICDAAALNTAFERHSPRA